MITDNNTEFQKQLEHVCNKYADKTAVTYMRNDGTKTDFTFKQIFVRIQKSRTFFEHIGLYQGDRVAVIAPQSPFAVFAVIALAYSNITSVLIDATLPIEEINRLLALSDVRTVFTTPNIFEGLTSVSDIPVFDLSSTNDIYTTFDGSAASVMRTATVDPALDVFTMLFSSGTTSEMKGIEITFNSTLKAFEIDWEVANITDTGSLLHVLPMYHVAGLMSCLAFLLIGGGIGMIEDVDASKLQKGLTCYNPTHFLIVPKVYEVMEQKIKQEINRKGIVVAKTVYSILNFSGFLRKNFGIHIGNYIFKSIRKQVFGERLMLLATGGSLCGQSTASFFLDLGISIWANFYATTETNIPAVVSGVFDNYPAGTEGNVNRYDCIDIKINEPDENGIGEVRVKTELIMKGYFREPELTAAAFDEDGYFKTGDFGYVDKKGYLHITGRIKEAIHLHTGKKVAPTDIDNLYGDILPNVSIASCGVPSESDSAFDEIHIFIEKSNMTAQKQNEIKTAIINFSSKTSTIYKISTIHFIDKLPMTSINKVKRYQLKEIALAERIAQPMCVSSQSNSKNTEKNAQALILRIVSELADEQSVTMDSDLKDDLGLDSLDMLELCVALEGAFNISIDEGAVSVKTVQDLLELVNNGGSGQSSMPYDIKDYPLVKKKCHILVFRFLMGLSRLFWKFEISGIENIPNDRNYILAPNHQSYLDSLWIWTAIGHKRVNLKKICCLAAEVFLPSKFMLSMLGGIPVERNGNTVPAMKRGFDCIQSGYTMLIHPEGTRTRDGKMHEFKGGAAKLAIDANVPIIPVRIDGAWDIFPPHKKMPRIFNWKRFSRHKIRIVFGKPIKPGEKTVEEFTALLQNKVKQFGADLETSGQLVPKL